MSFDTHMYLWNLTTVKIMNIPITVKFPSVSPQRVSLKNNIKNFCTLFTQIYQFLTSATFACILMYISIWCCSVAKLCPTLCDPWSCNTPGFPVLHCISWSLLKLMSIESVMAIQPSHPLLPLSLLGRSLFQHQDLFHWVSSLHQVAKVLELSISPFSEYLGLSSFRIDCLISLISFPLWGDSQSLLQHRNSKASILWHPAFFMVQLSHPYLTAGKTEGSPVYMHECVNLYSRHTFPPSLFKSSLYKEWIFVYV